jgi:hypothetical protein
MAELLDRWLTSLELHGSYLDLDHEAYGRAQAWPPHQRPTRWIIDLARTRTQDLKRMLAERQARGDADFADALELMSFLTTLLGFEHVERFIPLAIAPKTGTVAQRMTAPSRPVQAAPSSAREPSGSAATPATRKAEPAAARGDTKDATNRMPAPVTARSRADSPDDTASTSNRTRIIPAARPAPRVIPAASGRGRAESGKNTPARTSDTGSARLRAGSSGRAQGGSPRPSSGRASSAARAEGAASARTARAAPAAEPRASERIVKQVIADAVRMLDWGSEWPQLAGLIARLADRPGEKEVWRILREHRATIDAQAKARAS